MSAFGPFSGVEQINFEEFYNKNLFLITGNTGSGKTTIFDAICFALYGLVCGQTKESKTLRSNFANLNQLCFVELSFEVRGKTYFIKRVPEQQVLKLKGDGLKLVKHNAQLIMANGEIITNLKEINEVVEKKLIGFDLSGFNKIAMLPQGQFQKLLSERGEKQLKTFREIFETEIYESIANGLFSFKQNIVKKFELFEQYNLKTIDLINSTDFEFLKLKIEPLKNFDNITTYLKTVNENDRLEIENLELILHNIEDSLQNLEAKIQICKLWCEKKDRLNKINLQLAELNSEKVKMGDFEKDKILLNKIENLKFLYNLFNELTYDLKNKQQMLKNEQLEFNSVLKKLDKFQNYNFKMNKLDDLLNISHKKLLQLELWKNSVELGSNFDKELKFLLNKLQEVNLNLNKIQNQLIYLNFKLELDLKLEIIKQLKNLTNLILKSRKLKLEIKKLNRLYLNLCDRFFKQQASILTLQLKEGEPCPVCGSLEHIKKIDKPVNEIYISQQNVETIRNNFLSSQKNLNLILTKIEEYKLNLKNKHNLNLHFENYLNLKTEINNRLNEFEKLKKQIKTKFQNFKYVELNLEKSNLELKKTQLEIKREQLIAKHTMLYEKKIAILKKVPVRFNNLNLILKMINIKTRHIEKLKYFKQFLTNEKNLIENKHNKLKTKISSFRSNLKELTQKQLHIKNKLNEKLKQINFDELKLKSYLKNFQQIKTAIEKNEQILKKIEELNFEKNSLTIDLKLAQNFNITEFNNMKLKKINKKNKLKLKLNKLNEKLAVNEQCWLALSSYETELTNLNSQFSAAKTLAEVAKGARKRIGFERFVLVHFINNMLSAANVYLKQTTQGRYTFEQLIFDKLENLNLTIFDVYSGKTRDVTTLSGGETFLASLSLCLGLRDIAAFTSNNAVIGTMLIDEGFGTLDLACLASVVECLQKLSCDGGVVGIISHVNELKEQIKTQIQIKTNEKTGGSKIYVKTN